jgi:hypothetical protein
MNSVLTSSAGGVTVRASSPQFGRGYIRFVGGLVHNEHLDAPWCEQLDLVYEGGDSECALTYRLTVVRDPTGVTFLEYHISPRDIDRALCEALLAMRLLPIPDLEHRLEYFLNHGFHG